MEASGEVSGHADGPVKPSLPLTPYQSAISPSALGWPWTSVLTTANQVMLEEELYEVCDEVDKLSSISPLKKVCMGWGLVMG